MKNNKKSELRWFVWSVVFLVIVGVALVSYIMLTDVASNNQDQGVWLTHQSRTVNKK